MLVLKFNSLPRYPAYCQKTLIPLIIMKGTEVETCNISIRSPDFAYDTTFVLICKCTYIFRARMKNHNKQKKVTTLL